jgi:hypothetical protein
MKTLRDVIQGLQPVDPALLADYEREMAEEAIPKISSDIARRQILAAEARGRYLNPEVPKMSWSFAAIGKPENVIKALDEHSEKLERQSREEFDAAKPHLQALLRENFNNGAGGVPTVHLKASGHGSFDVSNMKPLSRVCQVSIESSYTQLV